MSEQIQGFTKVEFLLILVSIAYGYCVVDIFSSWSKLIRRKIWYWEPLLWSVNIFMGIAFLWYNAWNSIVSIQFNLGHFLMTLIPPIFIFVLISLLFPIKKKMNKPQEHFLQIRKLFFQVGSAYILYLFTISMMFGELNTLINYMRIFFFLGFLVNSFIDSKVLRGIVGALLLVAYLSFIFL